MPSKSFNELCFLCNNQTIIIPKIKLDASPSIIWLRRTLAFGINGFSKIRPEICGTRKVPEEWQCTIHLISSHELWGLRIASTA